MSVVSNAPRSVDCKFSFCCTTTGMSIIRPRFDLVLSFWYRGFQRGTLALEEKCISQSLFSHAKRMLHRPLRRLSFIYHATFGVDQAFAEPGGVPGGGWTARSFGEPKEAGEYQRSKPLSSTNHDVSTKVSQPKLISDFFGACTSLYHFRLHGFGCFVEGRMYMTVNSYNFYAISLM